MSSNHFVDATAASFAPGRPAPGINAPHAKIPNQTACGPYVNRFSPGLCLLSCIVPENLLLRFRSPSKAPKTPFSVPRGELAPELPALNDVLGVLPPPPKPPSSLNELELELCFLSKVDMGDTDPFGDDDVDALFKSLVVFVASVPPILFCRCRFPQSSPSSVSSTPALARLLLARRFPVGSTHAPLHPSVVVVVVVSRSPTVFTLSSLLALGTTVAIRASRFRSDRFAL